MDVRIKVRDFNAIIWNVMELDGETFKITIDTLGTWKLERMSDGRTVEHQTRYMRDEFFEQKMAQIVRANRMLGLVIAWLTQKVTPAEIEQTFGVEWEQCHELLTHAENLAVKVVRGFFIDGDDAEQHQTEFRG